MASVRRDSASVLAVKILLVSQMYPGPNDPDLGASSAAGGSARGSRSRDGARGDRRAGRREAPSSGTSCVRSARSRASARRRLRALPRPERAIAALASGAPLVVTAHGRDVRNVGALPGIAGHALRRPPRGRRRRRLRLPAPRARGEGAGGARQDRGRRLRRRPRALRGPARRTGRTAVPLRRQLTPRKNVVRLADAFARAGEGTLDLRRRRAAPAQLEGRRGVASRPCPARACPGYSRRRRPLRPSLIEPFGQTLLEAWPRPLGRRDAVGGPPEFVPPKRGVLVDPLDADALAEAMRRGGAAAGPERGRPRGRRAARRQSSGGAVEAILERAARGRPA